MNKLLKFFSRLGLPAWVALCVCVCACGDGEKSPVENENPGPKSNRMRAAAVRYGSLTGRVVLHDEFRMTGLTTHTRAEGCSLHGLQRSLALGLGSDRGVHGVLVVVTGFDSVRDGKVREKRFVEISTCGFVPRFLAATSGDSLELKNRSKKNIVPLLGVENFARVVPPGGARSWLLDKPGRHEIACKYGEKCGRAQLVVLHHNKHTKTEKGGHFHIPGLPYNKKLKVHAWHPMLGSSTQSFRIGEHEPLQIVIGARKKNRSDK